jgi:hypothetical protein
MKKNKTKGSVFVVDEMEHKIRDGWQKYLERRGIDKNFGILLHSYTNWKVRLLNKAHENVSLI